ncbi:Hypothetical protein NTJ_03986 [Nesidiocoris tenuis]|uniref:Uncharacterized protein n=1 Tax=Nesidiocoris tenuis TaxID=355587 RepID=A0ABN7ALE4_9HEMI|nr:Hypothetical protein NTJ_03986 [Nesidiocoris tenuis]
MTVGSPRCDEKAFQLYSASRADVFAEFRGAAGEPHLRSSASSERNAGPPSADAAARGQQMAAAAQVCPNRCRSRAARLEATSPSDFAKVLTAVCHGRRFGVEGKFPQLREKSDSGGMEKRKERGKIEGKISV